MYNLPRGYLSYSAFHLWQKDKDLFRRRYYEGEKPFETVETIFGKTVHKQFEDERDGREKRVEVSLGDLPLLGYIDEFCEETLSIRDDKTGKCLSNGKPPWDAVKVRKDKQLVFYCMLVLLKYGRYNNLVELRWHETRFKPKSVEFGGHLLSAQSRELELTGRELSFRRRVFKWEIEKLKKEVLKAASDISEDYTLWQKETKR